MELSLRSVVAIGCPHRTNDGQAINVTGNVRKPVTDFDPALAMFLEADLKRKEGVALVSIRIRHDNSLDQRGAATAQWILRTGRILVVEDARNSDPAPPQAIVDVYGLRAFLLVPLRKKSENVLLGWISVHENRDTRPWTADDLIAAEVAVERVHEEFDASGDPFADG